MACAWRVCKRLTVRPRSIDRWTVLLTDDRLPCSPEGLPLYGGCTAHDHVVFALLLKGYAKLYGGYPNPNPNPHPNPNCIAGYS